MLRPTRKLVKRLPQRIAPLATEETRLDKLLTSWSKPVFDASQITFAPFVDTEFYIYMANLKGKEADAIRAKYPQEPKEPSEPFDVIRDILHPKQRINKYPIPNDPEWVQVNIKVMKNKVKVHMSVPREVVNEYERRGHVAPIEVRIIAAQQFGYPMEVLERMLAHHDMVEANRKEDQEFIDRIFGIAKKSTTKHVKTHTVSRPTHVSSKCRNVEFYDLTGLLDDYDETHIIEDDDVQAYHEKVRSHIKGYHEGDILFLGSTKEDQEGGFALVTKARSSKNFKLVEHPDDLFNGKKLFYSSAVEAMNQLWNQLFDCDIITDDAIKGLMTDDKWDMYD